MPALDGFTATPRFVCSHAQAADVFPDSPGNEIIAIIRHNNWAPCAVRIYDARGTVLFEAWHNGWIASVAWLPGANLLVCAAENSEVTWYGRGVSGVHQLWPAVLFAIHPDRGRRAGWVTTPSTPGSLSPAWYKCILPPEGLDSNEAGPFARLAVESPPDPPSTFRLIIGDVEFYLDDQCREVRRRFVFAKYNRIGGRPDPQSYLQLGDLPPIDPARAASTRPANDD
jgi:hypothetical protein